MIQQMFKYLYMCDECERKEIIEATLPTLPEGWKHLDFLVGKNEDKGYQVDKDLCPECQSHLSQMGWRIYDFENR